jgi:hypothetical protein
MEYLELFFTKYILGFALQSFLTVFGVYTFNKQKMNCKEYLFVSFLVSIETFIMKLLPISVGVQTLMNIIFIYLIFVTYLKTPPYLTIRTTALCFVLILLSEMIVSAGIVALYGNTEFQNIANNPNTRHYIGVLASIIFGFIIFVSYSLLKRKGEYHRRTSE